MRVIRIRHILAITAALALASGSALAQGKGKEHGKGQEKGYDKGHDKGRVNQHVERRVIVTESHGRIGGPPGLAKKPGGMPPGQYKKYRTLDGAYALRDVLNRRGYTWVRTTPYGESQYVYYRTRDGVLHRAIVQPGTTRLNFVNVPQSLLSELLSRLY